MVVGYSSVYNIGTSVSLPRLPCQALSLASALPSHQHQRRPPFFLHHHLFTVFRQRISPTPTYAYIALKAPSADGKRVRTGRGSPYHGLPRGRHACFNTARLCAKERSLPHLKFDRTFAAMQIWRLSTLRFRWLVTGAECPSASRAWFAMSLCSACHVARGHTVLCESKGTSVCVTSASPWKADFFSPHAGIGMVRSVKGG